MKIRILDSNHNLPLLVEPDTEHESSNLDNLLSWYRDNSELLLNKLLKHGAILFRGFGVNTISAFEKIIVKFFTNFSESDRSSSMPFAIAYGCSRIKRCDHNSISSSTIPCAFPSSVSPFSWRRLPTVFSLFANVKTRKTSADTPT